MKFRWSRFLQAGGGGNQPPRRVAPPQLAEGRPHVVIATHHKTGTVWLLSIFGEIAARTGSSFLNISRNLKDPESRSYHVKEMLLRKRRSIIFEEHSRFQDVDLGSRVRGLHMIRDPRAVVVSAARYHLWSKEKWLHVPKKEFDGMTYQQKINGITDEERLIFELRNVSGKVINDMLNFESRGIFLTIRYENSINDDNMLAWHDHLVYLGFHREEILVALDAVWNNSIFGNAKVKLREHIQSANLDEWKSSITPRVEQELRLLFPDALTRLGYE